MMMGKEEEGTMVKKNYLVMVKKNDVGVEKKNGVKWGIRMRWDGYAE